MCLDTFKKLFSLFKVAFQVLFEETPCKHLLVAAKKPVITAECGLRCVTVLWCLQTSAVDVGPVLQMFRKKESPKIECSLLGWMQGLLLT